MFKPLLRTLPSMSGNVKIACKLSMVEKQSYNEYIGYIRNAELCPLQNKLCSNIPININLYNGLWEYDVNNFYNKFSNYFYQKNFTYDYSTNQLKQLDLTNNSDTQDNRNKDYEYGCKRIQYSQFGKQFDFYAPIWIESVDDIPEYFEITVEYNTNIHKSVKIYIGKEGKNNYLRQYITRYANKIDNRVIYCLHESNQATYFGINVAKGGLVTVKDNVIGAIYKYQQTFQDFDNYICDGFSRNKIIMKQILPLSFQFNPLDLLTNQEKLYFKNQKVKIYGNYYKDGMKSPFYDFSIDYMDFEPTYKVFKENVSSYDYSTLGNVMDVNYPSLNDGKLMQFKYSNKITPTFCRWSFMYSNSKSPYITNLSPAYTNSSTKIYGEFPTLLYNDYPEAYIENNDMLLPINAQNIVKYKEIDSQNLTAYTTLYNRYISNWYNILYNTLDEYVANSKNWVDVKYNQAYFNGVLYNFTSIINNNDATISFDKFSVILEPKMSYISESDAKQLVTATYSIYKSDNYYECNTYITDDAYIIEKNDWCDTYKSIFDYMGDSNAKYNAVVESNNVFKQSSDGMYVDVTEFNSANIYYVWPTIKKWIVANIPDLLQYIEKIENEYSIDSYFELPIKYVANIEGISNTLKPNDSPIFNKWYQEYLYASSPNTTDKSLYIDLYNNSTTTDNLLFLEKNKFISEYNIIDKIKEILPNYDVTSLHEYISSTVKYKYVPYKLDDNIINSKYFKRVTWQEQNENYIYVDAYNISSLGIDVSKLVLEYKYVKVINRDHLKEITYRAEVQSEYKYYVFDREYWLGIDNEYKSEYSNIMRCMNNVSDNINNYKAMLDFLCNNLSIYRDEETDLFSINGTTQIKGFNGDLYLYMPVYKLTKEMFATMSLSSDYESIKPLYMFMIDGDLDYKTKYEAMSNISIDTSTNIFDGYWHTIKDNALCNPMFDSIYATSIYREKLSNLYNTSKFIEYTVDNTTYITYKDTNDVLMLKLDSDQKASAISKGLYTVFYSKYNINKLSLVDDSSEYYNWLNIIEEDGVKYGYYHIQYSFDNSIYSINTIYGLSDSFQYETINGYNIMNNNILDNYLICNLFDYINPFFTEILFNLFQNEISTVVTPSKFTLNHRYLAVKYSGQTSEYSSMLINEDKPAIYVLQLTNSINKKSSLTRYFNYITPYFKEMSIIPNYVHLKYSNIKNANMQIDNLYYEDVNINKYNGLNVLKSTEPSYENISQYEWKHFNDNELYDLEPEFSISINKYLTISEIENYKSKDKIMGYFIKYVNKLNYNKISEDLFLFLFNKYNVEYITDFKSYNSLADESKYSLTYKFKLI